MSPRSPMRHRYALASLLLVLSLLPAVVVAQARPVGPAHPLSAAPQRLALGGALRSVPPACGVGATEAPFLSQQYLYPPDDTYYTLLDPAACACAGPSGIVLSAAHVALEFYEACSLPVEVGIVAADLSDPACPAPLEGQYLCPTVTYDLEAPSDGTFDFSMPLGGGCCVTRKVFLMVRFLDAGDCGALPGLAVDFNLDPCVSYNAWPGVAPYDLDGYLVGNPVMYADAGCCSVVPATPGTWGRVKTLYR